MSHSGPGSTRLRHACWEGLASAYFTPEGGGNLCSQGPQAGSAQRRSGCLWGPMKPEISLLKVRLVTVLHLGTGPQNRSDLT